MVKTARPARGGLFLCRGLSPAPSHRRHNKHGPDISEPEGFGGEEALHPGETGQPGRVQQGPGRAPASGGKRNTRNSHINGTPAAGTAERNPVGWRIRLRSRHRRLPVATITEEPA